MKTDIEGERERFREVERDIGIESERNRHRERGGESDIGRQGETDVGIYGEREGSRVSLGTHYSLHSILSMIEISRYFFNPLLWTDIMTHYFRD